MEENSEVGATSEVSQLPLPTCHQTRIAGFRLTCIPDKETKHLCFIRIGMIHWESKV